MKSAALTGSISARSRLGCSGGSARAAAGRTTRRGAARRARGEPPAQHHALALERDQRRSGLCPRRCRATQPALRRSRVRECPAGRGARELASTSTLAGANLASARSAATQSTGPAWLPLTARPRPAVTARPRTSPAPWRRRPAPPRPSSVGEESRGEQRVVQLVGVARVGPGLVAHLRDRRRVERAEIVGGWWARRPARVDRLRAPLLERRVVEERVRLRVQDLVRERRRLGQVARHAADVAALDPSQTRP